MLARRLRLVKEKDFKRIFKLGKSSYTKIFILKILANELDFNRYGFIISSNVSKKATERNKLKRQFRAAIKEIDNKLITGNDLIFIVSHAALKTEYKLIKSELNKILFKLNK